MQKLSVIIPAAGSGIRMNSDIAKPFIRIKDKAILEYTLRPFLETKAVQQIIIPTSTAYISRVEEIFQNLSEYDKVRMQVIQGGSERQYSIQNAIDLLDKSAEAVAIHDAVRPFVTSGQILECMSALDTYDGAVLGVKAKDTIKRAESSGMIVETPDRSKLWQAQTPQIFRKLVLKEAYLRAREEGFLGTDDASLVERMGGRVLMVEGNRENLKITYPIDLEVAKLILGQ